MKSWRVGRSAGLALGAAMLVCASAAAVAECKKKTIGYFQQFSETMASAPSIGNLEGIAKSLTNTRGDPARGREVMVDRVKGNCLACHKVSALSDEEDHGDIGPTLDAVASRYTEAQLRQLVVNPKIYFQNTLMPAFYKNEDFIRVLDKFQGKPILTAAEVEDVVAFLKTLR